MAYQAGDLREYIHILQPVESDPDVYGRRQIEYTDYAGIYAKVSDVSGREYLSAAAIQQEDVVSFTIRAIPVTTEMLIEYEGVRYAIDQVNHLGYRRDYITIRARVVSADG